MKVNNDVTYLSNRLRDHITTGFDAMYRPEGGELRYPFLTAGSDAYSDCLWDWDSWLNNVALRQILQDAGTEDDRRQALPHERGCVLNFLDICTRIEPAGTKGYIPIMITRDAYLVPDDIYSKNMHKPCLAQHAAFLTQQDNGDAEWLREHAQYMMFFINNYRNHQRHDCGLYMCMNDNGCGPDNDPTVFDRIPRTSGSILLNCFMYRELLGLVYILQRLGLEEVAEHYQRDADACLHAVREHCWDERDGYYYTADFSFKPVVRGQWVHHSGQVRDWPCLPMRISMWTGFMAMWAGIATPEQADRMVKEHYRNTESFNAPYGVRTLSKMEKMYNLRASSNPSSWLGPIWGASNYLVFRGLVRYGYTEDARELAEKTIRLFGRDIERFGAMHEYYQPENGEPILNRGFMNWNYLVLNMIAWLEGRTCIQEF